MREQPGPFDTGNPPDEESDEAVLERVRQTLDKAAEVQASTTKTLEDALGAVGSFRDVVEASAKGLQDVDAQLAKLDATAANNQNRLRGA